MIFTLLFYIVVIVIIAPFAWIAFVLLRQLLEKHLDTPKTEMHFNFQKHYQKLSDSLTLRAVIISGLALLMLIPLGLVDETVKERGYRYNAVLADIASNWGEPQTLLAAMVVIPYVESVETKETITDPDGRKRVVDKVRLLKRQAYFLPKTLDIDVDISDEIRQRGIFKSLVYNADLEVAAQFNDFDVQSLSDNVHTVNWDQAWLAIGLSDTRAINSVTSFQWQNVDKALSPGTQNTPLESGFHAPLNSSEAALTGTGTKTLKLDMSIKGSGSFQFTPFGETTNVNMTSSWPHPSFRGSALPDQHDISEAGFKANWTIPHLARNYQQSWSSTQSQVDLMEFKAGVSMFEPVSLYSQVTRAVKYGLLFIGLTFLTLLIFEMAIERKLHMVQYALIGVALSLFFLVLLSLSEHTAFIKAYGSAALLTISMISCYVWVALRSVGRASMVFALLAALYAILYSLLQFEDFALLVGTGLLVFVVMVLMFVTRNIQTHSEEARATNEIVGES